MGTDMKNVLFEKVDVAAVKEYRGPEQENSDDEGKTDGPKEIVDDSQESLEGSLGVNNFLKLVNKILTRFLSTIIIGSNTH
ncbi:hypothetical protein X943_001850 [Babesia divergens]|uniref:Uncharacterized protein n=1 Tax=Babesia divergens TaxID=32595 RepID=A0AAD9GCX9_BABDI|nr:hypothetical protein X943_001850 [Babesia divergens]